MVYIWQLPNWTDFKQDFPDIGNELFLYAEKTGRISGLLKGLPEEAQTNALLDLMIVEAIKTSEIEGEHLRRDDVRSSIRNNLGLNDVAEPVADNKAKGAADLMVDVRKSFAEPLTEKKLFAWHSMLMQGARRNMTIGEWRTHAEPMQIVSGAIGKWKVHYEAPPSSVVPEAMAGFIKWFNDTAPGGAREIKAAPVRSAIAHLYFESIHPFEDGNGRIGRALSEKVLSQGLGRPVFLSLSKTIEAGKKVYYNTLQQTQGSSDITEWVDYFVRAIIAAQEDAENEIGWTLEKARFFDRYKTKLDDRHLNLIRHMFDKGQGAMEQGTSAKKYMALSDVSKATATRDLAYLSKIGALTQTGDGRSTRYILNLPPDLAV